MGAHNIEFEMPGTPSFSAIQKKFKEVQTDNRSYNGHREGYSGDFQTVREVEDHTDQIFDSYNAAHDYCMNKAEKWVSVIAVRYRFMDGEKFKYSAKVEKLAAKLQELNDKLKQLKSLPVKLPKFATCEGCGSKLSTAHAFTPGKMQHKIKPYSCPICGEGDFRPLSIQRSEIKINAKIKLAQAALEAQKKSEKEKGFKKFGKVGTLIAGWGAS